jgi:6-phosphogluconolactonase
MKQRAGTIVAGLSAGVLITLTAAAPGQDAAQATPAAQGQRRTDEGTQMLRLYIGTYTAGQSTSKGIYLLDMDPVSGELSPPRLAGEAVNPSFLAIHPTRKFLYAVGEMSDFEGRRSGAVSAFAIAPESGELTLLNQQPSGGRGPCHVVVDHEGRHVLVANYSSGSAAVLPIDADGRLGEPTAVVQHEGSGPNERRQQGPHAHAVNLDPAGRYAFVADLGVDKVFVYRFDRTTGALTPNDPPAAGVAPGAGPRHFAFHPGGGLAYVINELLSTVTAFAYYPDRGVLRELQTVPTLPAGFDEENTTAEIRVHPSGRFLYGSNRGHDSIAAFSIDQGTGRLTPIGHQSTGGRTPRNFNIDPSGRWLVAANQASDTLVVLAIDQQTGRLTPAGITAEVPAPVCVTFIPK